VIHTTTKTQVFDLFRSEHSCIVRDYGTWSTIRGEVIRFQAINNLLRGYSPDWEEANKLRETIEYNKNRRNPSFGLGNRVQRVHKTFFHGLRGRFGGVPFNTSVLVWISPLTKTTLADVLKHLGTHFGKP